MGQSASSQSGTPPPAAPDAAAGGEDATRPASSAPDVPAPPRASPSPSPGKIRAAISFDQQGQPAKRDLGGALNTLGGPLRQDGSQPQASPPPAPIAPVSRIPSSTSTPKARVLGTPPRTAPQTFGRKSPSLSESCGAQTNGFGRFSGIKDPNATNGSVGSDRGDRQTLSRSPGVVSGLYALGAQTVSSADVSVAAGREMARTPLMAQASESAPAASSNRCDPAGSPRTAGRGLPHASATFSSNPSAQSAIPRPLNEENGLSGTTFRYFTIGSSSAPQTSGNNRLSREFSPATVPYKSIASLKDGESTPFRFTPTATCTTNGNTNHYPYSHSANLSTSSIESPAAVLPLFRGLTAIREGKSSNAVTVADGNVPTSEYTRPKFSFMPPVPFNFQPPSSQTPGRPSPRQTGDIKANTRDDACHKREQPNSCASGNIHLAKSVTDTELISPSGRSGTERMTVQQHDLNTTIPAATFAPHMINELAAGFSALSIHDNVHDAECSLSSPRTTAATLNAKCTPRFGSICTPATIPLSLKTVPLTASINGDCFQPITTSTPLVWPSWTAQLPATGFSKQPDNANHRIVVGHKDNSPSTACGNMAKSELFSASACQISSARRSKRGMESQCVFGTAGAKLAPSNTKAIAGSPADVSLTAEASFDSLASDASEGRAKLRRRSLSSSVQDKRIFTSSISSDTDSVDDGEDDAERGASSRRFYSSRRGRGTSERSITRDDHGSAGVATGASARSTVAKPGSLQSMRARRADGFQRSQQGPWKQEAIAEFVNLEFNFTLPSMGDSEIFTLGTAGNSTTTHAARLPKVPDGNATHEDEDDSDDSSTYGVSKSSIMNMPGLLEDSEDLCRSQDLRRRRISKNMQNKQEPRHPPVHPQTETCPRQTANGQVGTMAMEAPDLSWTFPKESAKDHAVTVNHSKVGREPTSAPVASSQARVTGRSTLPANPSKLRQELPKDGQPEKSPNIPQKRLEGRPQYQQQRPLRTTQPQDKRTNQIQKPAVPRLSAPISHAPACALASVKTAPAPASPPAVTTKTAAKSAAGIGANTVKSLVNFFSSVEQGTVAASAPKTLPVGLKKPVVPYAGRNPKTNARPLVGEQGGSSAREDAVRRISSSEAPGNDHQQGRQQKVPDETLAAKSLSESNGGLELPPATSTAPASRTAKMPPTVSPSEKRQPGYPSHQPQLRPRSASLTTIPPYIVPPKHEAHRRAAQDSSSPPVKQSNTGDAAQIAAPAPLERRGGTQPRQSFESRGQVYDGGVSNGKPIDAGATGANAPSGGQAQDDPSPDSTLLEALDDVLRSDSGAAPSSSAKSLYLGRGRKPPFEVRRRKFLSLKPTDWVCAFCEYEHSLWMEGDYTTRRSAKAAKARAVDAATRLAGNNKASRKKKGAAGAVSNGTPAPRVKPTAPVARPAGNRTASTGSQRCKPAPAAHGSKSNVAGSIAAGLAGSSASPSNSRSNDMLSVD